MMTYSQFTQYVELHIREYVSEEMMVSSKTWQQKNNGVPIEGLVFKDNGALVDMPVMSGLCPYCKAPKRRAGKLQQGNAAGIFYTKRRCKLHIAL